MDTFYKRPCCEPSSKCTKLSHHQSFFEASAELTLWASYSSASYFESTVPFETMVVIEEVTLTTAKKHFQTKFRLFDHDPEALHSHLDRDRLLWTSLCLKLSCLNFYFLFLIKLVLIFLLQFIITVQYFIYWQLLLLITCSVQMI